VARGRRVHSVRRPIRGRGPLERGVERGLIAHEGSVKLACEALVSAYAELYGVRGYIYRFANIIGPRSTHGILFDLVQKLNRDSTTLEVLGDGKQRKSYLMVDECVDAMVYGFKQSKDKVNYFNLGAEDQITVRRIVEVLLEETGLRAVEVVYTGGESGWKGDVPRFMLSTEKMAKLGWKAKLSSEQAIRKAAKVVVEENLSVSCGRGPAGKE
jgi:UDP-glucose 4-epimerase